MDDKKKIPEVWRAHLQGIASQGGASKSALKQQASRRNVILAYKARFPGRMLTPRLLEIERELQAIPTDPP